MSSLEFSENKGNILVVDDTLANLKVLTSLLESAGYKVRGAPNGKSALMICEKRPPELVLLDIRMPEMDGYEVCRKLQEEEKTKDIPVIFISALDAPDDKVKGFKAGGVDYITKPFQQTEVLARVRTHLQLQHTQLSLKRHSVELEAANQRLKELDQLKSMFIASMSHELRTPLNSIIGFSGILLQGIVGELNDEQKNSLERIHRSGNHLLGLISDVIDISKIEAGRIDTFFEQFPLKELVDESIDCIRPLAEAKGLKLIVNADSWPLMYSDRKRLLQCLLNYLSNAVKFSVQGKITVSVGVKADNVEIKVSDQGIGIAKDDIPKLFEAFERLDTHLRVKAGGTGLGLYLTKKIAKQLLHGHVEVESQLGYGSDFTLLVPVNMEKIQGNN